VSPVKYELGFYIPEDGTLRSHGLDNLKSYMSAKVFFVPCLMYIKPKAAVQNLASALHYRSR
jgi:hypothetical protein